MQNIYKPKIDVATSQNIIADDIIYNINVSIEDICNQEVKQLNVTQKRICATCYGTGILELSFQNKICHKCNGQIVQNIDKQFVLDIRKKKMVYPREGHQGIDYNIGDLIVNINPKLDQNYQVVNNYDLETEHTLSFIEVYTEFEFYLKYINGQHYHVKFQPSQLSLFDARKFRKRLRLRIRDKGLPIEDTGRFGDLYIKFKIELPDISQTDVDILRNVNILQHNKKSLVKLNSKEHNQPKIPMLAIEL
jgi:DnaJ-class molecular chaperone